MLGSLDSISSSFPILIENLNTVSLSSLSGLIQFAKEVLIILKSINRKLKKLTLII